MRQLNQYAQQSQENYQEKFKDDYEPVEDVSKRLIENLKVRPKADDEPKKLQIQDATSKNNAKGNVSLFFKVLTKCNILRERIVF